MVKSKRLIAWFLFLLLQPSFQAFASDFERETRATSEVATAMAIYDAAAIGGPSSRAQTCIKYIEEMEKDVREAEKKQDAPQNTFEDIKNEDLSTPNKFPFSIISEEFKAVVEARGGEAKARLAAVEALLGNSIGFFAPETAEADILNNGSFTIPNAMVLTIWFKSVEEHFANALQTHSAEEFNIAMNLLETMSWQAASRPQGFVIYVENLPAGDEPPSFLESLIPGVSASYSCEHGSAKECAFDVVTSIPILKGGGIIKGGIKGAGKETAEEGGEKAAKNGTTLGRKRHKESDNFDDYVDVAKGRGDNYFEVPDDVWNKMTPAERRAANQKFLDRAIERGDDFYLSADDAPINGAYNWEIYYLLDHGYDFSKDAKKLVRKRK